MARPGAGERPAARRRVLSPEVGAYLMGLSFTVLLIGASLTALGAVRLVSQVTFSERTQLGIVSGVALGSVTSIALGVHGTIRRWFVEIEAGQAVRELSGWAALAVLFAELKKQLLRATDLVGRFSVVALLYASVVWLSRAPREAVGQLRGDYLDPALLAGPILGVLAWMLEVDVRYVDARIRLLLPSCPRSPRVALALSVPILWLASTFAIGYYLEPLLG